MKNSGSAVIDTFIPNDIIALKVYDSSRTLQKRGGPPPKSTKSIFLEKWHPFCFNKIMKMAHSLVFASCAVFGAACFAGNIVVEAEAAVQTESPVAVVTNAPAGGDAGHKTSGNAFLVIPEDAGNPPKLNKGFAKYEINIPADGEYRLWARVKWEGECSNSFTVEIDEKQKFIIGENGTFGIWHWVKYPIGKITKLIKLEKGTHTVVFRNREDGVALDQIVFSSDKRFVPVGIQK